MADAYSPLYESVLIIADENATAFDKDEILVMLEDATSPATRKFHQKMFKAVIDKGHVDFGDIPKSAGDIQKYSGYPNMIDVLHTMKELAGSDDKLDGVINNVLVVEKAIQSLIDLSATYKRGFATKTEYVAMEYNTYVYFCVEATSALIYNYIEFIKDPQLGGLKMELKNTQLRADKFYIEQLKKFNRVQNAYGTNYRQMLEEMCDKGRDYLGGTAAMALGIGAVIAAAIAIVPITREIIYQIYNARGKLAAFTEQQAMFLELNKACVENNEALTQEKRDKVIAKQKKLAGRLRSLSDKLRVKSAKSIADSQREVEKENKSITRDSLKDEVSNSPFDIV